MADLKVVTPKPTNGQAKGPDVSKSFNEYDSKAADLERDMYDMQDRLAKKKYKVKTTEETFNSLMENFFNTVSWEGYECYAISEAYSEFEKIQAKLKPSKNGKVTFAIKIEMLEATFHFIKKHTGKGLELAKKHRAICEDFSVAMAELNTDRNALMELATQAEAAKHGISVEDYKKAAQQIHADNNQPTPNLK